jgi:hypothetical protein
VRILNWSLSHKTVKYMRQAVTLAGFHSHKFNMAMENLCFIHSILAKEVKGDASNSWFPGNFCGEPTITCSNRYFISSTSASATSSQPFDSLVDPNGILASLASDKLVHTASNQVQYYEQAEQSNKGHK